MKDEKMNDKRRAATDLIDDTASEGLEHSFEDIE
jgi:hypothetical protein